MNKLSTNVGEEMQEDGFNLSTLIAPIDTETFKKLYWPHTPYASNEAIALADTIGYLPGLASDLEILQTYSEVVSILKPDGTAGEVQGGQEAANAYRQGFTCYLRNIETYIPEIATMQEVLARELGVHSSYMTSELFCSSGKSGVAMHSDYDVNLAFLVRGTKQWRLAKNTIIENQPGVCIAGPFQPNTAVRRLTEGVDVPDAMPDDAITYSFTKGGVLFLPRGWWHETIATGECLQINFVMKGPQLATLATNALSNLLGSEKAWREFAFGLGHVDDKELLQALVPLIASLRSKFSGLTDEAIAKHIISEGKSTTE